MLCRYCEVFGRYVVPKALFGLTHFKHLNQEVRMKKLIFCGLVLSVLCGCSSINLKKEITDSVFEKVTGKELSRNASQCPELKRQCGNGNYQEWIQNDGQKGCACN